MATTTNDYIHMRYKNGAIAVFHRGDDRVMSNKAQEQFNRHGDTAEIWLYRTMHKDWHRFHIKEGRTSPSWVEHKEHQVPATVVQYVKLTAE
jgi:hypothetical protein